MKEVLVAVAEYNRDANKKLVGILEAVPESVLREDQGSYYKSILGTLEHIAGSEIAWLKKFAGFFRYKSLEGKRLVTEDIDALKASFKDKPNVLYTILAEADQLYVDFVKETDAGQYGERITYTNYKGEKLEKTYWNLILHLLNHATHHRGEISALLDRKGVANDYSGFTLYRK